MFFVDYSSDARRRSILLLLTVVELVLTYLFTVKYTVVASAVVVVQLCNLVVPNLGMVLITNINHLFNPQ